MREGVLGCASARCDAMDGTVLPARRCRADDAVHECGVERHMQPINTVIMLSYGTPHTRSCRDVLEAVIYVIFSPLSRHHFIGNVQPVQRHAVLSLRSALTWEKIRRPRASRNCRAMKEGFRLVPFISEVQVATC